jgi:hypothetical protein
MPGDVQVLSGSVRRRITGVIYAFLAIAFVYAGTELFLNFKKTLLCCITIVGFALGSVRAARLAFDALRGPAEHRVEAT